MMSEATPQLAERRKTRHRFGRLLDNPVAVKELRSRMRGRRAFVVLTLYLFLMSGIISLVYLGFAAQASYAPASESRQIGKAVFAAVLAIQVFLVVFIGPAFTAGSISGEKERQTYDLLRTTLLPPESLVLGKLISALGYVMLLVLAAVPLQSIAFFLGGIDWMELLIAQLLIVVSAVTYALLGLYASSVMRTTLSASVVAYGGALFLVIGLPVLLLFLLPLGSVIVGGAPPAPWVEPVLLLGGILAAATNLPATIIVSEVILLEESTFFYFTTTASGYTLYVPSPWYIYLLLYVLLSWLLYAGSVRRIRRIAQQ